MTRTNSSASGDAAPNAQPDTSNDAPSAASPANHWKRRPRVAAIPREQAVRQGEITRLAFLRLGREQAIAFLNTDHETLGGRPLALATESEEGHAAVEAELDRLGADDKPA